MIILLLTSLFPKIHLELEAKMFKFKQHWKIHRTGIISKNNIKHFIVTLDLQKESKLCPKEKNMETSKLVKSMEKAMAPHSSTLAWKIPWVEDPGWLQSMESLRVRHDWATSLWLFTFMHWRRKWQSTPVFLPGESQGRGSLVGCCLWGRTESDTEVT